MKNLISCEFNIDTACVELRFTVGSIGNPEAYLKTITEYGQID